MLKEQLEKERLTSTQSEKTLDEILAHQNVRPPKQGLGFNPRDNKKKANPSKKVNFVREGHKEVGNGKKDGEERNAIRGNPNHHSAGKFNPSYVLCKGTKGDVYAKYVGPRNAFRWYSIWVPKSLVTNSKGPIL